MIERQGRYSAGVGRPACLVVVVLTLAVCCVAQSANASTGTRGPSGGSRITRRAAGRDHARHTPRIAARSPHAHVAIVGGSEIEVHSAPWQVAVYSESGGLVKLCGGTIIDLSHILTAAHCMFDEETGERIPADEVAVFAGTSHFDFLTVKLSEGSAVASVRVHPYYEIQSSTDADDIAVLTLPSPLEASATVQPIGLDGAFSTPPEGTAVNLTGFGREQPTQEPNGNLYSLGFTVNYSRVCGGEADALFVCASTPGGSSCFGDSGSPLTSIGSTPALVGILDFGDVVAGEEECSDGEVHGFANVAAPEITDFIEGSEEPPRAPRGGHTAIGGVPEVGHSLTCEHGSWTGNPSYTYVFLDSASGAVLQRGESPTYLVPANEAGGSVLCEVLASNAGGTGVGRTPSLGPIVAPPTPEVKPAPEPPSVAPLISTVALDASNVAVQGGMAAVKLTCRGSAICRGTLRLTVRRTIERRGIKKLQTVSIGTRTFTVTDGHTATVKVRLTTVGRSLLGAGRGRLRAGLAILGFATDPTMAQSHHIRLVQQKLYAKG